jgi:hypothetical protein
MKYSTYRFTLDLQKHQSQISIAVFQYDTAVRLYISLTDGGIPYHISDGCRAIFYGKRPDGTDLVHPCAIEGNTRIIYDFNDQTACCEGTVDAQICLYGIDGEIIAAPRMIIVASERPVNPMNIDLQDSTLSALEQIIASESKREDAEASRLSAENQRSEAEGERVTAENARIVAEESRVTAERERESAHVAISHNVNTISTKIDNVGFILEQFGVINEQLDKTIAYRKIIPNNSDKYYYINSIDGVTYRNLLDIPSVGTSITTSDGAITVGVTNDGLEFNGTGNSSSLWISSIAPNKIWGGKFYVTVKEPLPEGVELGVWIGMPGMDHIEYPIPQGGTVGSFDGYGNISLELIITGEVNKVIAPCLSYGKPVQYGEAPSSSAVTEINDGFELWNGKDYELGSLDSSGLVKEQEPYARSGFIEVPTGVAEFGIVRDSDVSISIRAYYYDADKTYISYEDVATDANSISIPADVKYLRLRLERASSRVLDNTLKLESLGNIVWDGTVEL